MLDRPPDRSGLEVGPICVLEGPVQLRRSAAQIRSPGRDAISQNRNLHIGGSDHIALDRRRIDSHIRKVC